MIPVLGTNASAGLLLDREVFAPDSHETPIVAPRLDEVDARVMAMRPVSVVGLELPSQHVHQEARLHFDV